MKKHHNSGLSADQSNEHFHEATAHAAKNRCHLGFWRLNIYKMSKVKKIMDTIKALPNYSKYKYADEMQVFKELDRLFEHDLNTFEYYKNFEIEAPLNSFISL